jgi:thioredoxin 1
MARKKKQPNVAVIVKEDSAVDEKKTNKKEIIEKRKEQERQRQLEEQRIKEKNRQLRIRTGAVAAIVLVIVAIFIFRTISDKEPAQIDGGNPDFAYSVKGSLDIAKLKSYNLPIILEFGADWCEPCKQMAPIITSLNAELQGKAIIRFINTDDRVNISESYDFQYIPTQVFINADGTPYNPPNAAEMQMDLKYDKTTNEHIYTTHTGTLTKEQLLDILKEMGME